MHSKVYIHAVSVESDYLASLFTPVCGELPEVAGSTFDFAAPFSNCQPLCTRTQTKMGHKGKKRVLSDDEIRSAHIPATMI